MEAVVVVVVVVVVVLVVTRKSVIFADGGGSVGGAVVVVGRGGGCVEGVEGWSGRGRWGRVTLSWPYPHHLDTRGCARARPPTPQTDFT
ncbi:hypothetical protein E2C01_098556 [Portunus trituberculatus]|uniref:Uncharacterized protein n=1 Tax=Portunus trituberculatus TaxID=210409 RepID=A0A5B7K8Q0_PORTR|nr:hypothetical protein [Portunus trituberculatus]